MFSNQTYLRFIVYGAAAIIIAGSLWYSNQLVGKLGAEEEKKVQLYADAIEFLGTDDTTCINSCETSFVFDKITKTNELVPTLLVDPENNITSVNNLDLPDDISESDSIKYIQNYLASLKKSGESIEIETFGTTNLVLFDESALLKQLRLFPYIQLLLVVSFFIILFIGFNVAKKNEQNKVWVGLAKETAHQLGTPVSSLMAWAELLKLKQGETGANEEMVAELEKDIQRLQVVTERFSKIGSTPELRTVTVSEMLEDSASYIRKRIPKSTELSLEYEVEPSSTINVNPPLFAWVIENLLKNALDAIPGDSGKIGLKASAGAKEIYIDVIDNGKGIAKKHVNQVFKPGFTTKKRGWGLGLSLTKRIIEHYHKGKIFVKQSEVGKGTTFRVAIPKG